MVGHTCNPNYLGGWGRRMAWTQEVEVAVTQDPTILLLPGYSETLSQKQKQTNSQLRKFSGITDWIVKMLSHLPGCQIKDVFLEENSKFFCINIYYSNSKIVENLSTFTLSIYQQKSISARRDGSHVIPALWKANAGRSQGQEFETSLTNMVKPRLY